MPLARILSVDDNPHLNEVNQAVLMRAGYEVSLAGSSTDALHQLTAATFDLIITDLFLPDTNAADYLATMKLLAPGTPILLVSGVQDPPEEILQQVDGFVMKAYSPSALKDMVQRLLNREKVRKIC
jgi:Response regulator containing CheY-like receiver, AAA-type ATPase, and DNA-binding domains